MIMGFDAANASRVPAVFAGDARGTAGVFESYKIV
jgi:hypothetical protein